MKIFHRDPHISQIVDSVSPFLHADRPIEAAQCFAELRELPVKVRDIPSANVVLTSLLHWLLNQNEYAEAARLLWNQTIFSAEPYAARLVWDTIKTSNSYLLMGAASMSKSYASGAWHLLDWVRDPEYTTVQVVGPSEGHLEANLFSHLIRMHRESKIPLPGQIGELFIGLDPRDLRSSISGVIIPPGVWKDVDNVLSNIGKGVEGFKIGGAFNPEAQNGPCGIRCEPVVGWDRIDRDNDDRWVSRRGWSVYPVKSNLLLGRHAGPCRINN